MLEHAEDELEWSEPERDCATIRTETMELVVNSQRAPL